MKKKLYENPLSLSLTSENFSQIIYLRNDLSQRELNLLREAIDHFLNKRIRLLGVSQKEVSFLGEKFPEITLDNNVYCLTYDPKVTKDGLVLKNEGFLGLKFIKDLAAIEVKDVSKMTAFLNRMHLTATSLIGQISPVVQNSL